MPHSKTLLEALRSGKENAARYWKPATDRRMSFEFRDSSLVMTSRTIWRCVFSGETQWAFAVMAYSLLEAKLEEWTPKWDSIKSFEDHPSTTKEKIIQLFDEVMAQQGEPFLGRRRGVKA
jgi:hypothetical protein